MAVGAGGIQNAVFLPALSIRPCPRKSWCRGARHRASQEATCLAFWNRERSASVSERNLKVVVASIPSHRCGGVSPCLCGVAVALACRGVAPGRLAWFLAAGPFRSVVQRRIAPVTRCWLLLGIGRPFKFAHRCIQRGDHSATVEKSVVFNRPLLEQPIYWKTDLRQQALTYRARPDVERTACNAHSTTTRPTLARGIVSAPHWGTAIYARWPSSTTRYPAGAPCAKSFRSR